MTISTISPPGSRPEGTAVPPLRDGQRLTQPEFHRRYLATPPGVKAELVEGIVYMASSLGIRHGESHGHFAVVLGIYVMATPGVVMADNATLILGPESEPQADLHLRIAEDRGGRSRVRDNLLVGPPEMTVEVSDSTEAVDLNAKRRDYARTGVLEYLVWLAREGALRAFGPGGAEFPAGPDGVYRSAVFPGLWIDVPALASGDLKRAIRTLNKGLKTVEHKAFVRKLNPSPAKPKAAARKTSTPGRKRPGRAG